jgi:hypothetical protein
MQLLVIALDVQKGSFCSQLQDDVPGIGPHSQLLGQNDKTVLMVPETEARLVFSWSQEIHPVEPADIADLRGALTIRCDCQPEFSCSTCDSIYK